MKLKDSVFYREYNQYTFVIDTDLGLFHRIPAPVTLFFDLFKKDTTESQVIEKLKKLFPDALVSDVEKDVYDFAEFLMLKGMVDSTEKRSCLCKPINKPSFSDEDLFFQKYTLILIL